MLDDASRERDPVHLAIRSIVVLGVLCAAFGLVLAVLFGYLNTYQRFRPYFMAMGVAVWFGPGVVLVACAYLMSRSHSRGAASAALATAVFQLLCATTLVVLSATFEPVSPLPIVLGMLWIVALADCIRRLVSARRLLAAGTERTRGFDAIVAPPVLSVGHAPGEARAATDVHPSDSFRGK